MLRKKVASRGRWIKSGGMLRFRKPHDDVPVIEDKSHISIYFLILDYILHKSFNVLIYQDASDRCWHFNSSKDSVVSLAPDVPNQGSESNIGDLAD